MPVLLIVASLAGAHPGAGHHHHERGGSRAIGDLEVEAALLQHGLPPDQAARMVTSWTHGIAAPEMSRAEGRVQDWGFDRTSVRVLMQRLADAEVLGADTGYVGAQGKPVCLTLGRAPAGPVELLVLDPRVRRRGPAEEEQMSRRLAITWVEQSDSRTAMLTLKPGDHATVVEVQADPNAPPRRRAVHARRVQVTTEAITWVLHDSPVGAEVCVGVKPFVPTARVVKGVPDLPPPLPQATSVTTL